MANKKGRKYLIDNAVLMAEWHWEKNNDLNLDPNKLTLGSGEKTWWKCPKCGHEWQAKILNRKYGRNCPCCSNRVVVKGKNDFQTTNPKLMKEWHWDKNNELGVFPDEITKGVNKKVWWICPNGHEYLASVLHRSSGTNCPICNSGRQTSFAEQAIFYYVKKYFPDAENKVKNVFNTRFEFDIFIPSLRTAIEYDGGYWHEKEKAKENELKKFNLCAQNGIKLIRIREPENVNYSREKHTLQTSGAINILDIKAHCVIFSDKTGKNKNLDSVIMELFAVLNDINKWYKPLNFIMPTMDIERDREEICKNLHVEYSKSLKFVNPELAKEWHSTKNKGLLPTQVSCNTIRKVWWKCSKCGYEWQSSISLRNKGTGCPKCAIEKSKGGTNTKAKEICQYSLEGLFIKKWDCISTASRELKINSSNISMCAKGVRPNAGGFRWDYEQVEKLTPLLKKEKKSRIGLNSKKVAKCDNDGSVVKIFNSLTDAEKETGINATSISKMLNGHIRTAGGYYWKFVKE